MSTEPTKPVMSNYRAILVVNKKLERPIQYFGRNLGRVEHWARHVLRKYQDGAVYVYVMKEELQEIIHYDEEEDRKLSEGSTESF